MRCRHNNTNENGDLMDEIVNSIPDSTNTTMESTATSAMSLLEEEMEVDHAFDITRPERELPSEEMELSLHDANVTDIVPTAPVTFKIVGSGTQRAKPKLASSDGYSYVVKRELKSGDVVWRCSVRGKSMACTALVKQSGNVFTPMSIEHIHPSKPGLERSIQH
ncbi:hypothetical protein DPMN_194074 [Dreissena polymorpha]|uniref:FLYWCH-type domain-containing protein n=1 Tax=Dreissena polymorpha TaxID=45954 RepID=A0A9D3XZA9_DREPO|nr:hypothetical protein DPMN_194074 [Dreissena polymorpha]